MQCFSIVLLCIIFFADCNRRNLSVQIMIPVNVNDAIYYGKKTL